MSNQHNRISPPHRADSTDTIALVIEVVFGFFGLMGLGWLYTGHYLNFILLLLGYWLLLVAEVGLIIATFGCLACVFYPLNIVLAIISGLRARDYVRNHQVRGHALNIFLVIGIVLVFGSCCVALTFTGVGEALRQLPTPQASPF